MDSQGDTEGGAENDATIESQMFIGPSNDLLDDEDHAENETTSGYLHEDVIQPKKYIVNEDDTKEANEEVSQMDTVVQQPVDPLESHPSLLHNHGQRSQEIDLLARNATALNIVSSTEPKSSLDDLQRSFQTWREFTTNEAAQMPLPSSEASSVLSTHGEVEAPLPSGMSLEHLELRPEKIALPPENVPLHPRSKPNPFISWMGGSATTRPKKRTFKKKQSALPTAPPTITEEVENYRYNITLLADHFAYFDNVASIDTRHRWCSRIVLYDRLATDQHHTTERKEPWPNQAYVPSYPEFHSKLKSVPDTCQQRVVLVEDLSPSLVDLLGATFDIPPHVFEEHLDRSGYKTVVESRKSASAWNLRSSAQGYSSVTWYRPVLPLMSLTSRLRTGLIGNQNMQFRCPLEECPVHNIPLGTKGNIWRHYTELCSEPGDYYKGSETEYPVGWEERATVWTQDFDGCKFVVVLLDPLPVVKAKLEIPSAWKQERLIPMGNHWIRKEEGRYVERRPRYPRNRQNVDDWADQTSFPTYAEDWPPAIAPDAPVHSEPNVTGQSQPQTTSTDLGTAHATFTATTLRRRTTRSEKVQVSPGAFDDSSAASPGRTEQETREFGSLHTIAQASLPPTDLPSTTIPMPHLVRPPPAPPPEPPHLSPPPPLPRPPPRPPSPPQSPLSQNEDHGSATVEDHGPFVPYQLIKARASSSARNDATFVTKHMRAYIESLQIPKSTLDEFDHFLLAPTKGKETQHDPFHPLFRAIHDDSQSLVDIIRISLQQIREGTLDEDLMQRRVNFWRALLHRLNFNLGELEQSLRAFVQFINEPETHTSRTLLPSQKLADSTRVTLRNCMGLIDRTSHSLLAEMQIVDSRKSITEAESISKLTELAFVFIPLSFVASLFSMQVHELDGGVPLYKFALVAMGFVVAAYIVRLSIRSSHLIDYKNNTIAQIREETGLQHNDSIPTHKFLGWLGSALGAAMSRKTRNFVVVFAPFTIVVATLAAILSPIVLLWLRKMDRGFTAVMTMLLLLLDLVLVSSVLTQVSDGFQFKPQERIREMQRVHKLNRKMREEAKRRRKRTAGRDLEQADSDSMNEGTDI